MPVLGRGIVDLLRSKTFKLATVGAASHAAWLPPVAGPDLAMAIRWLSGAVPGYQLALTLALTALAALGCVWLASAIYRRPLIITGHRVTFRELVGRRERPQNGATLQR